MGEYVAIGIIAVILAAAIAYIVISKRRGGCIGCPYSKSCGKGGSVCCSSHAKPQVDDSCDDKVN